MAPEIMIAATYHMAADWWSLGALTSELLTGHTPFYEAGMSVEDLVRKVVHSEIVVPAHAHVGPIEAAFITALLQRKPELRLGAPPHDCAAVLGHEWLMGGPA